MKWRGITEEEVNDTVLHPEAMENSSKGRKNAFKHIGNKSLKVTFRQENDTIVIITAIERNS